MSHWKTWQQYVGRTRPTLFLQQTGLVNRNYHVLNQLRQRSEIGKILSVDLIPFTTKRCLRVYCESILGKIPGKNATGDFEVSRSRAKVTKVNNKFWVYSTSRHLLKKDKAADIWHEILAIMDQLEFKNKLLWSYFPMYALPFEKMSGTKVFDAVDDWREHPYC
ncbi:hypothetical protein ACFL0Z_01165, partial [Patescibacteria group bacterium]